MNKIEAEGLALELAIAKRIRKARYQLDWTLEDLSKATGLSKGYLSQIENKEKVPPISTLTKIAFGLGMNINTLITGADIPQNSDKIAIGQSENRVPITHTEASPKSIYESFGFTKQNRVMDAYIITMGLEFPPKAMMHTGEEFVYVLEGAHEFFYDNQIFRLKAGDALYFDSDRPHMGRSIGKEPTKLLVVFCNRSASK